MKQNFFNSDCTPFVEFEEKTQSVYLDPFYESKGWTIVTRKGTEEYDLILNISGVNYKVEEKIRREDYNDLTIEFVQDIKTKNMGWFFKSKAYFIFYVICKNEIPIKLYAVNFDKLKNFIYKNHEYVYGLTVSKLGFGESWNFSIPWGKIPKEFYKLLLTEVKDA